MKLRNMSIAHGGLWYTAWERAESSGFTSKTAFVQICLECAVNCLDVIGLALVVQDINRIPWKSPYRFTVPIPEDTAHVIDTIAADLKAEGYKLSTIKLTASIIGLYACDETFRLMVDFAGKATGDIPRPDRWDKDLYMQAKKAVCGEYTP